MIIFFILDHTFPGGNLRELKNMLVNNRHTSKNLIAYTNTRRICNTYAPWRCMPKS